MEIKILRKTIDLFNIIKEIVFRILLLFYKIKIFYGKTFIKVIKRKMNHYLEDKNKLIEKLNVNLIKTKEKELVIFKKERYNLSMFNKINTLLLNLFMMFNLIIIIHSEKHNIYQIRKLESLQEVRIKIRGKGTQNILNPSFLPLPSEIYVNGNLTLINNDSKIYNLIEEENNIIIKWDNILGNCNNMFFNCENIIEIDLSDLDTSGVTSMNNMFRGCLNLKSLKLNNLNTSLVTSMEGMFWGCNSLASLNLSSFNTFLVTQMSYMFMDCFSLISLDLSNLKTSSLLQMMSMFDNCHSLILINLSNFKTSKVTNMVKLFNNCTSLQSLDLSSFDTSSVQIMTDMFLYCSSLTSLDLSNFNTTNLISMANMFYQCNKLISINLSNFNLLNCISMNGLFNNCSNLEYINMSNFREGNFSNNRMFDGVPKNLVFCSNNENYIPNILNELNIKTCAVNDCSNNWKIKQKIIITEKNICVDKCSEDNIFSYEYKRSCYNNCPEGTRPNKDYICVIDCPYNLSFEKNEECIEKCIIQDFYTNICIINNKNIKAKEYIINGTIYEIIDGSMNSLLLNLLNEEKKDFIIKDENEIYQITSVYNQKNKVYNDSEITINIGECENILKDTYNINNNETLITLKMDYFIEGFLIPITEYAIFHPQTKQRLDLDYCNDISINIYNIGSNLFGDL